MISQYKKKVEDAQELRKQLKVTEDRNIMYMQQNMDLEEVRTARSCDCTEGHVISPGRGGGALWLHLGVM